jgi:helix-turn-helix protein
MDSHIRVYIEANWHALGCLPPIAYKVLISLVQRADSLGRCFPSAERIAEDCGCNIDSVWTALKALEENRFMGYLRRNEQDIVTGRWLPNVYMVNPQFICIASEFQEDAFRLWSAIKPLSEISATNQQQEPTPRTNTKELTTETNNNNQRSIENGVLGEAPQNSESPPEKSKKPKSKKTKSPDDSGAANNKQSEAPQRSKKRGGSAATYKNPDAIVAPIPDAPLEQLANRVNRLGVPIGLARGFVMSYGGAMVEAALLQVAAAKGAGQEISNDGGFFRHLLQNNLVDSSLPEILKAHDSTWAEYSE